MRCCLYHAECIIFQPSWSKQTMRQFQHCLTLVSFSFFTDFDEPLHHLHLAIPKKYFSSENTSRNLATFFPGNLCSSYSVPRSSTLYCSLPEALKLLTLLATISFHVSPHMKRPWIMFRNEFTNHLTPPRTRIQTTPRLIELAPTWPLKKTLMHLLLWLTHTSLCITLLLASSLKRMPSLWQMFHHTATIQVYHWNQKPITDCSLFESSWP